MLELMLIFILEKVVKQAIWVRPFKTESSVQHFTSKTVKWSPEIPAAGHRQKYEVEQLKIFIYKECLGLFLYT